MAGLSCSAVRLVAAPLMLNLGGPHCLPVGHCQKLCPTAAKQI